MNSSRRLWLLLAGATLAVVLVALLVLSGLLAMDGGRQAAPQEAPAEAAPVPALAEGAGGGQAQLPPPPIQAAESPAPAATTLILFVYRSSDGSPLDDAAVRVRRGQRALAQGSTDRDGLWSVALREPPGLVIVEATAPGTIPDWVEATLVAGQDCEVSLALSPGDGWRGRVVTSLGDPRAGVTVRVRQRWGARPASVYDDGTVLVARPADHGGRVLRVTDDQGWYHVDAVPQSDAGELQIEVEEVGLVSAAMRIPLPLSFGLLPDLVANSAALARVHVMSDQGVPLPLARVAVDDGPGPWRTPRRLAVTGEDGLAVVQLGAGTTWLRVSRPASWTVAAHSNGQPLELRLGGPRPWEPGRDAPGLALLPDEDPLAWRSGLQARRLPDEQLRWHDVWIAVPPGHDTIDVTMARGTLVQGRLLSEHTGRQVTGGQVVLSTAGRVLARGRTSIGGHFALELPPEWIGGDVDLDISALNFDSVGFTLTVPPAGGEDLGLLYLTRAPVQEQVRVLVAGSPALDEDEVELRAFHSNHWDPNALNERFAWDPLPELIPVPSTRQLAVPARQLDHWLRVMARGSTGARLLTGLAGPERVSDARGDTMLIQLRPPLEVPILIQGHDPDRRLSLHGISWNPWFDGVISWRDGTSLEGSGDKWRDVPAPLVGVTTAELREAREPVFRWVDGLPLWLSYDSERGREPGAHLLTVPPRYSVRGDVLRLDADDWPDTCVALCGLGASPWRLGDLGAWDQWARPDARGRFRFDDVPPGDYAFVLYRPLGDHAVEILAERSVSVTRNLFNLDIWAEPRDAPLRRVVLSPWSAPGDEEWGLLEDLAAR